MESCVLATPRDYTAEFRTRLQRIGPVIAGHAGALVLESLGSRTYLRRDDAVAEDLDPDQIAKVGELGSSPALYVLEYSDIEACRAILSAIADDPQVLVDNDHGVFLRGSEFVALLRQRPSWDWRVRDETTPSP